jgi:hypothetical protein
MDIGRSSLEREFDMTDYNRENSEVGEHGSEPNENPPPVRDTKSKAKPETESETDKAKAK